MHNIESSKKYFVIPQSLEEFGVTVFGKDENEILFKIKKDEYLPAEETFVVSRFNKKFYLILSIDLNNIPTLSHEAVILSRVKNMPKKLKNDKSEKLPIIGFFELASVILLWNDKDKCYKFMDSWNGKFGKDLFLDFLLPKPAIVSSSTDVVSLNGAVYDFIKVMSMPPDAITIHPDWKFTITEDIDNPVLLEFDVFEKPRKQASPAFLLAIMVKEHLKAIKKETGKRPTKLGFRLLDEFESPEARKRVEAGLKEACEMIKIGFFLL
uniref:Uncharacterized protein n=1 Tax=Panagrolaimus davidi TaxID=227884 RepID=A0A914QJ54_9BILA